MKPQRAQRGDLMVEIRQAKQASPGATARVIETDNL